MHEAPDWFNRAVNAPYTPRRVEVEGCSINFLCWGEPWQPVMPGEPEGPPKPGILLVHGNGAHARWWSFIAPFLMDQYYVVAMDLGGMGDSGTRSDYHPETFVKELMAVVRHGGFREKPVVVGHSFGGFITLLAGSQHADELAGTVLVDSPLIPPERRKRTSRESKHHASEKPVYPDFDTALSRFRLQPSQPCDNRYIMDYIGRHSLKEVPGGWTWKFDWSVFNRGVRISMKEHLEALRCRVAIIRGEHSSIFPMDTADYMSSLLNDEAAVITIPEAHHHIMLDQPLAFVSSLRSLLAEWRCSVPLRRLPEDTPVPPISEVVPEPAEEEEETP